MSTLNVCKVVFLAMVATAIVSFFAARSHLIAAHKADLAKQDRACLSSVFKVTQIVKNHKRRVPKPVLVSEGFTK